MLRTQNAVWIESADSHVVVHTENQRHLWRRSLSKLEGELSHSSFVRVHRSALVQLAAVREVRSRERGDFTVVLNTSSEVAGSRRFRQAFFDALEN
ncbi:MAG: two-component system LytT family response regulator [Candidatus Krumholzibacteriia bacterium]|jgi:two-component system LytT family response regulator